MDPEQAAITLGVSVEKVRDLAAAVGADPDDLEPEDLVAMASLLDAEADEDDDEDEDADDEEE
jgi:cell division protein YceG involved in septum cleavage